MKMQVDAELCVGCGLCTDSCPEVFTMEENKAVVNVDSVPADCEDSCKKLKKDCPVEAIMIEE